MTIARVYGYLPGFALESNPEPRRVQRVGQTIRVPIPLNRLDETRSMRQWCTDQGITVVLFVQDVWYSNNVSSGYPYAVFWDENDAINFKLRWC